MNVAHIVTGAVQPKINQGNMNGLDIIMPDKKTLVKFKVIVDLLYATYRKNVDENKSALQIRDSFLPKLMSGKIRVKVDAA